jgi:hypothetical protein
MKSRTLTCIIALFLALPISVEPAARDVTMHYYKLIVQQICRDEKSSEAKASRVYSVGHPRVPNGNLG